MQKKLGFRRATMWIAAGVAGLAVVATLMHPASASASLNGVWGSAQMSDCRSCHVLEPVLNHPVNVAPSMTIPADFPLENGRIACGTCHLTTAAEHAMAKQTHNGLLRGSGAANFCANCHTSVEKSMHVSAVGRAHLGTAPRTVGVAATDEYRSCAECHDGVLAANAQGHSSDFGSRNGGHAVGVAYKERFTETGDYIRLHATTGLDSKIRLFENQVNCGSCHSVYAPAPHRLVMSNKASKLCLSCHNM